MRPPLRLVPSASPRAAARRAVPPAVRQAITAAEQGLEIVGTRWGVWLAHQFLHDAQFRAAMPREPFRISRYDWIIFPPPHLIALTPGEPARLVPLPPLRIDPRYGLRMPPARLGQPRQRRPGQLDVALDRLMIFVQARVDSGQRRTAVLFELAKSFEPETHQRDWIKAELHRAWWRHRKAQERARRLQSGNDLHDLSRTYRGQC